MSSSLYNFIFAMYPGAIAILSILVFYAAIPKDLINQMPEKIKFYRFKFLSFLCISIFVANFISALQVYSPRVKLSSHNSPYVERVDVPETPDFIEKVERNGNFDKKLKDEKVLE